MGIYLKRFARYFIIFFAIFIFIKIFIITWLIIRGEWPASFVFLLSIIQWDKEALKILALVVIAALVSMYGYMGT